MSFFGSGKPRVIVETTGMPIVQEITTTSPMVKSPGEKTLYSSRTVSYSTPSVAPRIVSHNEYKYNSKYSSTVNAGPAFSSTSEFLKGADKGVAPVYFEALPLATNTNNIFEIAPPHEEAVKITYSPRMEIYSTAGFAILMMDLPGVTKENLSVELEKGLLRISGKKEKPKIEELENEDIQFHTKIVERCNSYYFFKLFQMPPAFAGGQNISCVLSNGELIIKILANEVKSQKLVINVE